jgi:hypothetical protein
VSHRARFGREGRGGNTALLRPGPSAVPVQRLSSRTENILKTTPMRLFGLLPYLLYTAAVPPELASVSRGHAIVSSLYLNNNPCGDCVVSVAQDEAPHTLVVCRERWVVAQGYCASYAPCKRPCTSRLPANSSSGTRRMSRMRTTAVVLGPNALGFIYTAGRVQARAQGTVYCGRLNVRMPEG